MKVIRCDQFDYIETPGGNFGVGLATPSRGAAEVSLIRQRQQSGGGNPPHTHDREEVMLLLDGMVTVALSDESVTLAPGDTLIVPPRTPHQVENAGDQPAEWLLIAPAGVRFFHANGEEAKPSWAQ